MPKSDLSDPHPYKAPRENDWTKPAAMAIPKEGYFNQNKDDTGWFIICIAISFSFDSVFFATQTSRLSCGDLFPDQQSSRDPIHRAANQKVGEQSPAPLHALEYLAHVNLLTRLGGQSVEDSKKHGQLL
jgi:hypothetical protein